MRITHVVESLGCGGMERLIVDLGVAQRSLGHDVSVCCLFDAGILAPEACAHQIPTAAFNRQLSSSVGVMSRLVKHFRRQRPDVVITHNPGVNFYGAWAARLAGVRSVISVRHGCVSSSGKPYSERAFRAALPVTDVVVCVSQETADFLIGRGILKPGKTRVIVNGINIEPYLRCPANPGHAAPQFRIGILARLAPVKGHAFLLKAFSALRKQIPNIELHIAGDGPLLAELKDKTRELDIAEQTHFHGQVNAPDFLKTLDLLVCSSHSEGTPLAILEGMAAGLPIVSRALRGIQAVAPEGDVAWYADTNEPSKFAEVLREALQGTELAIRGGRARAIAQKHFDIRVTGEKYNQLLLAPTASRRVLFT